MVKQTKEVQEIHEVIMGLTINYFKKSNPDAGEYSAMIAANFISVIESADKEFKTMAIKNIMQHLDIKIKDLKGA